MSSRKACPTGSSSRLLAEYSAIEFPSDGSKVFNQKKNKHIFLVLHFACQCQGCAVIFPIHDVVERPYYSKSPQIVLQREVQLFRSGFARLSTRKLTKQSYSGNGLFLSKITMFLSSPKGAFSRHE